jgi:tetratricopeptide (TPR) repeat protein
MRRWLVLALALAVPGCIAFRGPTGALTADQHNDRGVAYFERGDARRAAQEFERALALRPDWARALVNLGDARLALGEVRGAIEVYGRAVAVAPDDTGAANNLAWALLQDPVRWVEAEAVIRGALARQPEPRGYYLDTLGAALLKKGNGRGALDAFRGALADEALTDRATRALVLEHAAEAHASLGDHAAAARCRALAAPLRQAGTGRPLPLVPVGDSGTVC